MSGKMRSNENVLSLSKVSLFICMLGWFSYFWISLFTGSLLFETSHNQSSLTVILSSFTTLLKNSSDLKQRYLFLNLDLFLIS